MIGLILKDIYTMKKQFKTYLLILLFYSVMSFFMEDSTFINVMIIVLLCILPITTFSFDNYSKWDSYQLSLPVSRKQSVAAKYLFSILPLIAGVILSLALSVLFSVTGKENFPLFPDRIMTTYVACALGLLIISIMLPLVYKFGPERSRVMMFAVLGLPAMLVIFAAKYLTSHHMALNITGEQIYLFFKISPLLLVIVFILSILISMKIYSVKEF